MDNTTDVWQQYYQKALSRPHSSRTELAVSLNTSGLQVAVDCGCGTGSDIAFLSARGYQVHGFDVNSDSVSLCRERFAGDAQVSIFQAAFEDYAYPGSGVIIAHSSLFFADPASFEASWQAMASSLAAGGVFSGDFMGMEDSWATGYRTATAPMTRQQVTDLFAGFDIIQLHERNEQGITALGRTKQWHIFSVVAVKRS
ncbi:methyltransferase domain-containing protein [Pseudomonas sp. NyZ704]|nr:methyltransferase domain-containing protein [Pseudomonas sp. NyZ704]